MEHPKAHYGKVRVVEPLVLPGKRKALAGGQRQTRDQHFVSATRPREQAVVNSWMLPLILTFSFSINH